MSSDRKLDVILRGIFAPVAFALLLGILSLHARAGERKVVSIAQAVEMALRHNTGLQQAENLIGSNEAAVQRRRAAFIPDLSLSVESSERVGRTDDNVYERGEVLELEVSSSIPLYDGSGNRAAYDAARLELEASRSSRDYTRQKTVFGVLRAFLRVGRDRDLAQVADENLAVQQEQLGQIQALWEEGRRARVDVLLQQSEVAQARLEALEAERAHLTNQMALKRLIGMDQTEDVEFALFDLAVFGTTSPAVPDSLVRDALENRPDLAAYSKLASAAKQRTRREKSRRWPSLSLFATAETEYSSFDRDVRFADQFLDTGPTAAVGLKLSIPLFDRGQTKERVARSLVQFRSRQLDLADAMDAVSYELRKAMVEYDLARRRLNISRIGEEAARQALAAMKERYAVGTASLAELNDVHADCVEATAERVESQYDLASRRVTVDFHSGHIELLAASL